MEDGRTTALAILHFRSSILAALPASRLQFHLHAERPNHFAKFRKCCSARISVGAISATLKPLSSAINAAHAATAVLPEPTSPCNKRRIGCLPPMSARISLKTFVCAAVSLKPSCARNGFIKRLSPPQGKAFARPRIFSGATGFAFAAPQIHPAPAAAARFPHPSIPRENGSCEPRWRGRAM